MSEDLFRETAARYTEDTGTVDFFWAEIHKAYTAEGRYYHNLTHVEHLLRELSAVKPEIEHWDEILFAAYYHDIVYSVSDHDNEEQSAVIAKQRLGVFYYTEEGLRRCSEFILATKGHSHSVDSDTNFFTDADLSVLGAAEVVYDEYARNVRKEYSIYPDLIYKPGRRKVLQHFLAMPKIFKTDIFFDRYEAAARGNLQREMEMLG